jgi:hypothetical protein
VSSLGFAIDLEKILADKDGPQPPDRPSHLRLVEPPAEDDSSREAGSDPRETGEEVQPSPSMDPLNGPFSPLRKKGSIKRVHRKKEENTTTESKGADGPYAREHRRKQATRQENQETLYSLTIFNAGINVGEIMEITGWSEKTVWRYLYGRPDYYLGLVELGKVRVDSKGPGRGQETKVFPVLSLTNPEALTREQLLRLKWAKHENDRAAEWPEW